MTPERLYDLINRYLAEVITDPEREELAAAIEEDAWANETRAIIQSSLENREFNYGPYLEPLYVKIAETAAAESRRPKTVGMMRWAAAAVFIGVMAVTGVLVLHDRNNHLQPAMAATQRAPEKNRAMIQLADGRTVYLDQAANGSLASVAGVELLKLADGRIVYKGNTSEEAYNILTNPTGSQPIDIGLNDGSHVWLNAGSSIRYPMAFVPGKERVVSMTGEAFFEVKHDEKAPFKVKTQYQTIEDIGTSFNVNAYPDEAGVKTSLVEGSVRIGAATLSPGEQYLNGTVTKANLEQALAWKNGFFGFDHADIHTVMREIGRWYDVEVRFEGEIKDSAPFQGEIARGLSLAQLLKHLENYPVRFRMEGVNRIIVSAPER